MPGAEPSAARGLVPVAPACARGGARGWRGRRGPLALSACARGAACAGVLELGWGLTRRRQTLEPPRRAWGTAPPAPPGVRVPPGVADSHTLASGGTAACSPPPAEACSQADSSV